AFYDKAKTRLVLGRRVGRIDREGRAVVLEDGSRLAYSTLVLATGSRPRALPLPGSELEGVFYLRNIADVAGIRRRLARGKRLGGVGGGYIARERGAVAMKQGLGVTALEAARRLMARGVGRVVSEFYARLHGEEGVVIRTGAAVLGFEGNGRVERVVCAD